MRGRAVTEMWPVGVECLRCGAIWVLVGRQRDGRMMSEPQRAVEPSIDGCRACGGRNVSALPCRTWVPFLCGLCLRVGIPAPWHGPGRGKRWVDRPAGRRWMVQAMPGWRPYVCARCRRLSAPVRLAKAFALKAR